MKIISSVQRKKNFLCLLFKYKTTVVMDRINKTKIFK